jgi:hypothetical protein
MPVRVLIRNPYFIVLRTAAIPPPHQAVVSMYIKFASSGQRKCLIQRQF